MNKICTDIEQAKKLIELGIDMDTADMSYSFNFNSETYELSTVPYKDWIVPKYAKSDKFEQVIPAWSLSALLELIPDELQDNHFLTLEKEKDEYCCCFEDINGNSFNHFFGNNAIDVAFEMMCWLLDSRKL